MQLSGFLFSNWKTWYETDNIHDMKKKVTIVGEKLWSGFLAENSFFKKSTWKEKKNIRING